MWLNQDWNQTIGKTFWIKQKKLRLSDWIWIKKKKKKGTQLHIKFMQWWEGKNESYTIKELKKKTQTKTRT